MNQRSSNFSVFSRNFDFRILLDLQHVNYRGIFGSFKAGSDKLKKRNYEPLLQKYQMKKLLLTS